MLALAVLLVLAAPASAITQKQAAKKALTALGTEKRSDAVIVFGLPKPVRAGTVVTQAGTSKPAAGSTSGLDAKLRGAGVRVVRPPVVLRGGGEKVFVFYEDRGPFMLYQHPGRVALVGADSGRVKVSRTITWPPLVNGRLPAFLKSANAYRSAKYQVLYRAWETANAVQQASTPRVNRNLFDIDPFGPGRPLPSLGNSKAIAARLAAERSCVLRVTDTLPSFWNVNDLNMTRSYVGTLFEQLERDNGGFIDDRYGARTGESLGESVDRLVAQGCKDVLLYIAGEGYDTGGEPVIQLGTSLRKGGLVAQQNLSASDLAELISERPATTFKLKIDAPYAGGMIDRLKGLQNVLLVETAASAGQEAFAFIPNIEAAGQMVSSSQNPAGMLEFTNCELIGLKAFFDSATEIDKATQAQNEGVSFLVEMLARSHELCQSSGAGFWDEIGVQPQLYAQRRGSGNATNLPPKADPADVSVTEDQPKAITLGASDPDGDPLTFTITKQPEHGTLSGSGANRTYTPDANYVGPDDFSFKADDGEGASSNTAKVSLTVVPGNDAPVLASSNAAAAVTEGGAADDVNPGMTAADVDDTHLESAKVRVTNFQAGDVLAFVPQLGITGTYDSGTGILTLTGNATTSDWATALGSVTFRTDQDNPSTPKVIEFVANDGTDNSAPVTKNVAVTPVNDAPVLDTSDAPFAYTENTGSQKVDDGIALTDPDSTITGATIQITSNHLQAEDDLAFADQLGITGSYNQSTGTLTLSGTTTVANYQTALRDVRYVNSSDNPSTLTRTVSFRVDDGAASSNLSNVATRDVTVTPADDAPVGVNDIATVNEDSSGNGLAVLTNDTDVDGGPREITGVSTPTHGTASIVQGSPDTLSYTPTANYCGSDSFTYTLNGGGTATVNVTVTCLPDDPVANNDSLGAIAEDATATDLNVLSNDTDADTGDAIEITNVSGASKGVPTIVDGSPDKISYTPSLNACGSESFTYTVNGGDTATVTFTVTCVEDNPVANDDSLAAVNEDAAAFDITALANDTDADTGDGDAGTSETIEITGVSGVDRGTATVVDGSPDKISYTPSANACGAESFTYTVNGGDTATVSFTVTCLADDPVASNDTASFAEDTTSNDILVVGNDVDPDAGDPVEITQITDTPDHGSAAIVQGTPDKIQYTPTANYCGSDSLTYEVNGGDTAVVNITVTCVEDNPVANDDTPANVLEDASAFDILVLGNDTDADTGDGDAATVEAIDITGVSGEDRGTATVVQGTPDKISYTPTANACGAESFTYTVNGGDTATVSFTVTCVDDLPVAVNDLATVGEDSGANQINVRSNDNDGGDGGTFEVASVAGGTKGTPAVTNGGTDVSYTPSANECGADSFTYTLNGGSQGTVNVTITCINDAPVVDLNGGGAGTGTSIDFLEQTGGGNNNTAVTIAPSLDISDVDDVHIESATVTLTNEQNGPTDETLAINETMATNKGINVAVTNDGDLITLTSNTPDSVTEEDYEDVLKTVTYRNTANTALLAATAGSPRTVEFKVNDGNLDSGVATATVNVVPLNVAPSLDLSGADEAGNDEVASFTEGGGAVVITDSSADPNGVNITDPDDTQMTSATVTLPSRPDGDGLESLAANTATTSINASYTPANGVLALTGADSVENYEKVLKTVTYNNTDDDPTTTNRSVTFTVHDGQASSNTATSVVSVAAVNDAPSNTVPGGQSVTEDTPTSLTGTFSVSDPDAGSSLLKFTMSVTNGTLTLANTTGLTFTDGTANGQSTLKFTATQTAYNTALGSGVTYAPNLNWNGIETLSVTSDDQGASGSGGAQTDTDNVQINVTAVNDGPQNTVPQGTQTVNEDTPLVFSANSVTTNDVDSGSNNIRVTLSAVHGVLTLGTTTGLENFSGGDDGTADKDMTFDGTLAEVQAALNNLTYQGDLNYNNTMGAETITLTVNDLGNTGTGGALQDVDTIAVDVTPVNDAPEAHPDTFNAGESAVGNTLLAVSKTVGAGEPHKAITGNVLNDDTTNTGADDDDKDVENDTLTVTDETKASNGGGTVDIDSDGTFHYTSNPAANCPASDTFTYTVSDGQLTDTETVTIAISGCVWYVDNDPAETGNAGTSLDPFDALSSAEGKSVAGSTTYVHKGTTAYTGGYTLDANEKLIGEHSNLTVGSDTLFTGGGDATRPTITDVAADVIELGGGTSAASSVVRGIEIDPNGGGGIAGSGAGDANGTIDNVDIVDTSTAGLGEGLELTNTGSSSTYNISDFTYSNTAPSTPAAVSLSNAGTVNFSAGTTIQILKSGGPGLVAAAGGGTTSLGSGSVFDNIAVISSTTGAVSMTGTTGVTTFGDGSGTDLSLDTDGGTAFALDGTGQVTVPSGGNANITADNGPAVNVNNPGGGSVFNFDDVDSTNSTSDGIRLASFGNATFDAANTSNIQGAGTTNGHYAFELSGGNGTVNFPGTITESGSGNTSNGDAVSVANRTGGTATFSGTIADDNDSLGGIDIQSNNSGSPTINFSGTQKKLETANANDNMLVATGNTGASINFTNGGLDVDSTSGSAVAATGGGTLRISRDGGNPNTIVSTTGTALNVDGVAIANEDLVFESISSNGAANGIRLNGTTNANGNLQVTSTSAGGTHASPGTACTNAASCTGGMIQNSVNAGIELTNVPGGAVLTRVGITGSAGAGNNDGAVTDNNDDGIDADTVGTGVDLRNSLISNNGTEGKENGLDYSNVTGTSTILATNVTGSAEHNAQIESGTGTHNIDIVGSSFTSNSTTTGGDGVQLAGGNSATVNTDVTSSTFTANRGFGFHHLTSTGSPTMNTNFIDNDVTGGNAGSAAGASGAVFAAGNGTDARVRVENNDILNSVSSGIILNPLPNSIDGATFEATVNNNRIGNDNPNSGGDQGSALFVQSNGSGDSKYSITNNTMKHWQQNGMRFNNGERILGGDPSTNQPSTVHYTVSGNTLSNPDAGSTDSLFIAVGPQSGGAATDVCFDLGVAGAPNVFNASAGVGQHDVQIEERFAGNLWLPQFAGDGSSAASLQSYFAAHNTGTMNVNLVDNPVNNGTNLGSTCSAPTSPPAVTP